MGRKERNCWGSELSRASWIQQDMVLKKTLVSIRIRLYEKTIKYRLFFTFSHKESLEKWFLKLVSRKAICYQNLWLIIYFMNTFNCIYLDVGGIKSFEVHLQLWIGIFCICRFYLCLNFMSCSCYSYLLILNSCYSLVFYVSL